QSCANDGSYNYLPVSRYAARGGDNSGATEKCGERSELAAFLGDRRHHRPALFLVASVGIRQSALANDSRQICRGCPGFHPDYAGAARGSAATYPAVAGREELGKFGRASEASRNRDPILALLSGPDSAGSGSLVSDGYRHLRC